MSASVPSQPAAWKVWRWPLTLRVLLGVLLGTALGAYLGAIAKEPAPWQEALLPLGPTLGSLGGLVVRLLQALAMPLIFFAILDAFLRTDISGRQGVKMIVICLVNVAFAFALGLAVLNLLHPGLRTREAEAAAARAEAPDGQQESPRPKTDLPAAPSPLKIISDNIPTSVIQPFAENRVLSIVILAIVGGVALRRVRRRQHEAGETSFETLDHFIEAAYHWSMQILEILIEAVPLAVFGLMAQVVAESGVKYFERLIWYFPCVLLGLGLHSLVYYSLSAWLVGKVSPRTFFGQGLAAVITGFSANSSLAVVPVTLRCLNEGMGVSPESARMSACVGTNFNNDGITLYEAMTALFAVELIGHDLEIWQQLTVILASLLTSLGMAGLPGSGLIILPLVLKAAGLDDGQIAEVYPLFLSVDWLLARIRTAVNVMGDMQVAILLDAGRAPAAAGRPPA